MKFKKIVLPFLICLVNISIYGAQLNTSSSEKISNQSTLGVVWVMSSGEYDALCYQGYNLAYSYLKDYIDSHKGKKVAITLDLDETALDNSPYAGWQIINKKTFSPSSWNRWVEAKKAIAIPGSLEFTKAAKKLGITIYYISNRNHHLLTPTIQNMKNLGFPFADEDHILLKKDSSNKKPRMDEVRNMGYTIALSIGDNLDDFDSEIYHKSFKERKKYVFNTNNEYGTKRIILPNPNYGSFEGAISKDYWKLSSEEKIDARYKAITPWDGL